MMDYQFEDISAQELKKLMEREREADYLVVDVRTVPEYEMRHIPGAKLIPLSELERQLFELPSDRKLVFYCHSGGRSQAASMLASEAEISEKGVYNLDGGMLAWDGYAVSDFPRVDIFKDIGDPARILTTAIDLEKGAHLFYSHIRDRFPDIEIHETISRLAKAETAHAKAVYALLEKIEPQTEEFEALFEKMPGNILEGGARLAEKLEELSEIQETDCMRLVEIALEIEYAAYDLYRSIAENTADESARESLLKIAQMEKAHMAQLAKATEMCNA